MNKETVEIKKHSWTETKDSRDKLRVLISKLNKIAGKKFNSSKLSSINECCEYIYNLFDKTVKYSDTSRIIQEIEIIDLRKNISSFNKINNKLLAAAVTFLIIALIEAIVIFNVM